MLTSFLENMGAGRDVLCESNMNNKKKGKHREDFPVSRDPALLTYGKLQHRLLSQLCNSKQANTVASC